MKKIINTVLCSLALLGSVSCQDELDDELFQKYSYIIQNGWKECEVKIEEDNTGVLYIDFGVNGTSGNDKDIVLTIANDPDTLAGYNFDRFKYQTEAYFPELPQSCYTFDQESYTIPAGELIATAKVSIDLNNIENPYNDYVLPITITSSTGEPIGPDKYSKLLANIKFANKYSGSYSGNGKLTLEEGGDNTATEGAKLYAISPNTCFMYAGNATADTDPDNYKDYILNVTFADDDQITITDPSGALNFEQITAKLTREYEYHATDTRYYVETSVLTLKYRFKNLSLVGQPMQVFEGTHTMIRNVLRSEYPDVTVKDE